MTNLLIALQVVAGIGLIATVLIRGPKGEGLGGIGGTAHMFGSSQKGLQKGLDRVTTIFAVSFISISLLIGILGH